MRILNMDDISNFIPVIIRNNSVSNSKSSNEPANKESVSFNSFHVTTNTASKSENTFIENDLNKDSTPSSNPQQLSERIVSKLSIQSDQLMDFQTDDSHVKALTQIPANVEKKSVCESCECYLVTSDLEKQQIIDQIHFDQLASQSKVICIASPEELNCNGLLQQVWIEGENLKKEQGLLFLDQPLIVVFDLTQMNPGEIARFNNLLQANPMINDHQLKSQIKRVVIAPKDIITGKKPANPDTGRRLKAMVQKTPPAVAAETKTDTMLLAERIGTHWPDDTLPTVVDFAGDNDWRIQLFGGIIIDEQGVFRFQEGAISRLQNNHLMLKDAPWGNTQFEKTLASAIRRGGFEANRQWVRLPEKLVIYKHDISIEELESLKTQAVTNGQQFNPFDPFICINQATLESLRPRFRLEQGRVYKTDSLANFLEGYQQLVITGQLDDSDWLWLFKRLQQLPVTKRPVLMEGVPPENLISCSQVIYPSLEREDDPFYYEITAMDSLESFRQITLDSKQSHLFSVCDSNLMDCLLKGRRVVLVGLERNPALARQIETLFLQEKFLFLHGVRVPLPQARIQIKPPKNKQTTGSVLLDALLDSASDNKITEKIDKRSGANGIYQLLESLPSCHDNSYPRVPPWTPETFQSLFDQQSDIERKLDHCEQIKGYHRRRALNLLLSKAYRGNRQVYCFIKAKIEQLYPDEIQEKRVDQQALQQQLVNYPDINMDTLTKDFWSTGSLLSLRCT